MSKSESNETVALVGANKEIALGNPPHNLVVGDKVSVQGVDLKRATVAQAKAIGCTKFTDTVFEGTRVAKINKILGNNMGDLIVIESQGKEYFTIGEYCIKRPPRKQRESKKTK